MKAHQQNAWQFVKLFLAALVFVFGTIACGGGSSGDDDDGATANINPSPNPSEFDLSVSAFSISPSPVVTAGYTITLSATVSNAALAIASSPATTLRFYRYPFDTTTAPTFTTTSNFPKVGGAKQIGELAAAATSDQTSGTSAPRSRGTYWYGACVVGINDITPNNNCSVAKQVVVTAPPQSTILLFDLSVPAFSVTPSSVAVGDGATVSVTFGNAASATVSATGGTLNYYRSTDATITASDFLLGGEPYASGLGPGDTETYLIYGSVLGAVPVGTWYYGACIVADDWFHFGPRLSEFFSIVDSDPSNNCSAGVQVVVTGN